MTEQVTIIGAGPAGLAVAGSLKQNGIRAVVLEASAKVGSAWRNHYDRLHLHTHKGGSALPGFAFPADYPRYPSRDQFVAYLEGYARHFEIAPAFGERVTRIARNGDGWTVATSQRELASKQVVIATGLTRVPSAATWPGLDTFRGDVLHSSRYRNGSAYAGKRVLVVGLGNSGGEIAIDLHEQGAHPTLAVRSPVNVIPRELLGIPILAVGGLFGSLSPRLADKLGAPLIALSIGNLAKLGLRKPAYGPREQLARHGRVPLIDVGTLALARAGHIKIAPGIERFTETEAVFEGGATQPFDAVVLATGYRPILDDFLAGARELCDAHGALRHDARPEPGLHLCGFRISPRGMLNAIASEAKRIAGEIAAAA